MFSNNKLLAAITWAKLCVYCFGFNFAPEASLIYKGPTSLKSGYEGSYFGYSIGVWPKFSDDSKW